LAFIQLGAEFWLIFMLVPWEPTPFSGRCTLGITVEDGVKNVSVGVIGGGIYVEQYEDKFIVASLGGYVQAFENVGPVGGFAQGGFAIQNHGER
jgi:hypothetical protein